MVDELQALETIHQAQKKWRRFFQISFIAIIIVSSVLFVVIPKSLPPMIMQLVMVLSMASVFGLFFLDRISHLINKKKFKQDIVHKYLFKHLKPDDVHKDSELVLEMVTERRKNGKGMWSV